MTDSDDLTLPSLRRLQSAEQMELLDVVDSLRACGLSEIVALPQLIVCGDQSSGKSSVLEAISGIPFPKQDNLCTRFATEVILRRATKDGISVSIVPGADRAQVDGERLRQFHRELKTKDDFSHLFEIARDAMGLSSTGKSFSNDVLRVEICGPSQPQLTLVDLPGLIHSETKSQTPDDVKLVHSLVSRYLENPRSIILAVVSAKNDIGNQIILHRARKVDPQGSRTLGIITKPDLLVKGSKSEEAFIALARNEEVKFSLGWHMVKNLDSAISTNQNDSRDQQETLFFQESGFNCLPAHTVGITFLRARLSKVLFSQIRTELPRLVQDIQAQISAAKGVLHKLGPSRTKVDEQRSFLISLSESFQTICRDAVRGDYDHEFFQDDSNPERRLCANVMNMHFNFAKNIRLNGASWIVEDGDIESERYRTREEAIKEACALLKRSRGRELPGLPNPLLVGELFRQYSRPWGDLARVHIKNIWETTNRFLELLLRHLTDDDVCENIFRFWLYPIMEEKLNSAYSKLDELLEVHKDYPMTTNSHFISNSKTPRQDNSKTNFEAMMKKALLQPGQNVSIDEISRLLSTMNPTDNLDMDMIAAEEAFDNMNAYYEVAMNLFTDNVPTLAIQAPIIREVPKIFCPTAVFSMDSDIIERIAGESEEKIRERDQIMRRLGILENGARICKLYAKRPQPLLNFSSEDTQISELPVVVEGPDKDSEKTSSKPPSTPQRFPESVPDKGIIQNPFSHLLTPSATDTLRSRSPQASVQTQKGKTSISSINKTDASIAATVEPVRRDLKAASSKPSSTPKIDDTKPSGRFFSSASSAPFTNSFFSIAATKTSGEENKTKPSGTPFQFESSKPIFFTEPPSFKSLLDKDATTGSSVGLFGSTSSTPFGKSSFGTTSTTIFGGDITSSKANRGLFSGPAHPDWGSMHMSDGPAKDVNALKFPPNNNKLPAFHWNSTLSTPFKPFTAPEPSSTDQLNSFQHICFMPTFRKCSCEELRLSDYERGLRHYRGSDS